MAPRFWKSGPGILNARDRRLLIEAEPASRLKARVRTGIAVASWVIAVPLLLFEVVRLLGWDVHVVYFIALSTAWPLVATPGLLAVVGALYVRRRLLGVVATLMLVVVGFAWSPTVFGQAGSGPKTGLAIRLLALNVEYSQATGAAASRQIKANNPDIVVLSELSVKNLRGLDLKQYRYSWERPEESAFGQGIYSRWPIVDRATWSYQEVTMAIATVQTPRGAVRVYQVHTMAPQNSRGRVVWAAQLKRLTELLNAEQLPFIAAGDFNASTWDGPYSGVLGGRKHIVDAGAGRGYLPTWPSGRKWLPPVYELDHVLVPRDIGVRHFRVLGPMGSDHRAVVADLLLP
jgi:endonuclease/exonuclease/phosphatase (EEP) superfamily protein YafD